MPNDIKGKNVRCSFCGKSQDMVRIMFGRGGTYICDECVEICGEYLKGFKKAKSEAKKKLLPSDKRNDRKSVL